MSEERQFTVTLGQLNQMAAAIDALGKQVGVMATAPLLAQLTALTKKPSAAQVDDGEKPPPGPPPPGDNGSPLETLP